ncbi:hypothetical protein ACFSBZ_09175 [Amnibacterium flavum]|uniref:Uncharacterized protein n=1 Tax=Amnibacterium flavum TaxID=2173173 RepID=A0A2V1HQZ6_9MICO|nr:hypothetical protein [Amnibacterium flavum]PVZ95036.1 hypothetical protein DDQ50_00415 [Amnibacterium flavum]
MTELAPSAAAEWREPNSLLPLRWGSYSGRQLVGAALVLLGAFLIVQTTAYTTLIGWLGSAMHVAGWAILPARGGRRVLAAPLSMLAFWLMLLGPNLAWLTSASLALWLLVRRRPGIAYVIVPLPALIAVAGLVVFGPFLNRTAFYAVVFAVAAACAWAARNIAVRERTRSIGSKGEKPDFPR